MVNLRARLSLLTVSVIAIVVALYGTSVYLQLERVFIADLDNHLHQDFGLMTQSLKLENGVWQWMDHPHYHDEEHEIAQRIEVWSADGKAVFGRTVGTMLSGLRLPPPATDENGYRSAAFGSESVRVLTGKFWPEQDLSGRTWLLRLAISDEPVRREKRALLIQLMAMYPIALLLAAGAGWWLAGRLLRPITHMTTAAQAIHAGSLHQRLPVEQADEIGRLAITFNEAFSRVEEAFIQLKNFSADVAHELRTPLTALRMQGELALRNPSATMDGNTRKVLITMLEEAQRLSRLIDRLLLIARADQGQMTAVLTRQRLAPIIEDAVQLIQVVAEERNLTILIAGDLSLEAAVDNELLCQTLIDLLDNALRHAKKSVTVRLCEEASHSLVDIEDDGPGIPEDQRDRLLQRFARGDRARTRSESSGDGFGLGLAIAQALTRLQRGSMELGRAHAADGSSSGLRVRMRFGIAAAGIGRSKMLT